jgi:methionyl-tRNA formyltransferase
MARPAIVIATPHPRHDELELQLRHGLSDFEVVRMRSREDLTFTALGKIKPIFVFFPHWSWLIPEDVYSSFDCVIFHMTDLTYGRGGSPLQNLIAGGNSATMLSAFKCVKELDAGPLYLKRPLSLAGTAEKILQEAAYLTEKMIVEIVEKRPLLQPQKGEVVEFKRRRPEDGNLSALTELRQVYDHIRMLDAAGYPPAFLKAGALHFEFTGAQLGEEFIEARVRIRREPNV